MQSVLSDIINRLQANQYPNEQAINQGIILRLLDSLHWDVYDPQVVKPELNVNGAFVDFALCHPIGKPQIFIEVKQSTTFNVGEDQLMMRYAFQHGVPIAILTDEQRWSFYLPGGTGSFEERRFYHLDLVERDLEEIASRLKRYLSYEEVKSNRAFEAARFDHEDAARRRAITEALPSAWIEIVQDADFRLIAALLEKVETTTGYRPVEQEVENFLKQQVPSTSKTTPVTARESQPTTRKPQSQKPIKPPQVRTEPERQSASLNWYSINDGVKKPSPKAIETTVGALKELIALVPDFMVAFEHEVTDFSKRKKSGGEKRRWVARKREDLYQNPKLIRQYREIAPNWWLGTNYSNPEKRNMLSVAKKIAERSGVKLDFELE